MQDFVHLHVHTQYSLLDGQASVSALVDKAMKDGMKGIAVTDHGNMFGIKEFTNYVNKKNSGPKGEIKDLKKRMAGIESGEMIRKRNLLTVVRRLRKLKISCSNQSLVVRCMWLAVPWIKKKVSPTKAVGT